MARLKHIRALLSAPPITPNWNKRKATTIVAPEETNRIGAMSGENTILRMKSIIATGPYRSQNLLEISLVLRSLRDAAMRTPRLNSNATNSSEGGVTGFIKMSKPCFAVGSRISLLELALVMLGTSRHQCRTTWLKAFNASEADHES